MFLQSHGIGAPTQTAAQLLVSCPLQHPGREAVFRALTAVPHLGPQVRITEHRTLAVSPTADPFPYPDLKPILTSNLLSTLDPELQLQVVGPHYSAWTDAT